MNGLTYNNDYGLTSPAIGARVELHPGCDLWMRGAKYGVITRVDSARRIATVRMDHPRVRKLQRLPYERLKLI